MRKIFLGLTVLLLTLTYVASASAHHKQQVLGASTSPADIVFPPVTAGPGLILPDSPFYLADKLWQNIRLAFTLSPVNRVKLRTRIAGERMAELRVMFARNNTRGIQTALQELTKETRLATNTLADSAARGKDISEVARELNETIKSQRQILKELRNQTTGELELKLDGARKSLDESKIEVEDHLNQAELEREIENRLNEIIEEQVEKTTRSTIILEKALQQLRLEASEAAQKALKNREEALKKAIEERDETLRRVEEKLLENEKKKQTKLLEAQEKAVEQAREAIRSAQEAAQGLKTAQEAVSQIKSQPVTTEPQPRPTPNR